MGFVFFSGVACASALEMHVGNKGEYFLNRIENPSRLGGEFNIYTLYMKKQTYENLGSLEEWYCMNFYNC